jgi:hypothetical protein
MQGTILSWDWSISNSSIMGIGYGCANHLSSVANPSWHASLELQDSKSSYETEAGQANIYCIIEPVRYLPITFVGEGDREGHH